MAVVYRTHSRCEINAFRNLTVIVHHRLRQCDSLLIGHLTMKMPYYISNVRKQYTFIKSKSRNKGNIYHIYSIKY
jgi:hypothetical protein